MYIENIGETEYVRLESEDWDELEGKRLNGHGKIIHWTNAEGEHHPAFVTTEDGEVHTPMDLTYDRKFDGRHDYTFEVGAAWENEEEEEEEEDDETEPDTNDTEMTMKPNNEVVHELARMGHERMTDLETGEYAIRFYDNYAYHDGEKFITVSFKPSKKKVRSSREMDPENVRSKSEEKQTELVDINEVDELEGVELNTGQEGDERLMTDGGSLMARNADVSAHHAVNRVLSVAEEGVAYCLECHERDVHALWCDMLRSDEYVPVDKRENGKRSYVRIRYDRRE